ncbi:MAG: hypothetical protein ACKN9F_04835 [Methylomonas sp.]
MFKAFLKGAISGLKEGLLLVFAGFSLFALLWVFAVVYFQHD